MTEELLVTKLTMIASQIQHKDDLMGQRTNWLVVSALEWPRLRHRTTVVALGHLLPITVAAGFTLAWVAIMITLGVV